MKTPRALLLKLALCASLSLLISTPGAYAAVSDVINGDGTISQGETRAIVGDYNSESQDEVQNKDLEGITQLGEQYIQDAEAAGGGEVTTQAIMTAVLDAATAAGAEQNQIDAILARLVAASKLRNASLLGDNARGASGGGSMNPTSTGQTSTGANNPVATNTTAGGNTLLRPAGCSDENLQCIADGNGLTVQQVRERLANGATLVPPS